LHVIGSAFVEQFPAQVFDVRINHIERVDRVDVVAPEVLGNRGFGEGNVNI
jgi:hypothetical protein